MKTLRLSVFDFTKCPRTHDKIHSLQYNKQQTNLLRLNITVNVKMFTILFSPLVGIASSNKSVDYISNVSL